MLPSLIHRLCRGASSASTAPVVLTCSHLAGLEASCTSTAALITGRSSSSSPSSLSSNQAERCFSSEASTSKESGSANDWKTYTRKSFSIRPSFLSPLQGVYRAEAERQERRELLVSLLQAHRILADEIDGLDDIQIQRNARHRIEQIRSLSQDFAKLLTRQNLPGCENRDVVLGYYSLLEESAIAADKDAQAFYEVSKGHVHAWRYWAENFEEKYANVPSLEPVEKIYARPDPINFLRQLKSQRTGQRASSTTSGKPFGKQAAGRQAPSSSQVDIDGVAHSLGRRKTSFARVKVMKGSGSVSVNGIPLDDYFSDIHIRAHVLHPFAVTQSLGSFDVVAETKGGGLSGQAQAIRTGISRALAMQDVRYGPLLGKLMRWDGREVERKKPGQRKARKAFTWVKR